MDRNVPDPERVIAGIADPQRGLVRREQLLAAGFSTGDIGRRIASGRLVRVLPGVYKVASVTVDAHAFQLAALMAAGEEASLIHRSASGSHGFLAPPVGVVHVGRPGSGRATRWRSLIPLADGKYGYVAVAKAIDLADESELHGGERRTLVPRTLVDLAESAPGLFDEAWREAQYRGLLDSEAVHAQLDGTRRKGNRLVRAKLADMVEVDVGPHGVESPAEFEAIQMVLRAGAPPPLVNAPMVVCGKTRRPDLFYAHAAMIVEIDGWNGHKTRESFEDDRLRDSDFLSIGILTMRFTARRIQRHPVWCAERILSQLAIRSGQR